jgi:hypothetical protein
MVRMVQYERDQTLDNPFLNRNVPVIFPGLTMK